MWQAAPGRCPPSWSSARARTPSPRPSRAGSRPLPELSPGQQWEVDSSLVDPEGLVARATGAAPARNGGKQAAAPGIAAGAAALPERVVENAEWAEPLGVDSEWISSRTGIHRRRRVNGET